MDSVGFWKYDAQGLKSASHGGAGRSPGLARNYVIRDFRNDVTVALFIRENSKFTRAVRQAFAEAILDYVVKNPEPVTPLSTSAPIIDYDRRFHPVIGKNGIVAAQETTAAEIGLQVLKDGGNAADAAVAVAYAPECNPSESG